jgi:hypothetical protein
VNITIQFSKSATVTLPSAASDWLVFSILLTIFGWGILAQATPRIVGRDQFQRRPNLNVVCVRATICCRVERRYT